MHHFCSSILGFQVQQLDGTATTTRRSSSLKISRENEKNREFIKLCLTLDQTTDFENLQKFSILANRKKSYGHSKLMIETFGLVLICCGQNIFLVSQIGYNQLFCIYFLNFYYFFNKILIFLERKMINF